MNNKFDCDGPRSCKTFWGRKFLRFPQSPIPSLPQYTTNVAQPSTSAEDALTPPVMLDSITVEYPPSESNVASDSPESEPKIGSNEDEESELSDDEGDS